MYGLGEATLKKSRSKIRTFRIIEYEKQYVIKRKIGPFWFYVRYGIENGFRKRQFDFTNAVRYVNSRRFEK